MTMSPALLRTPIHVVFSPLQRTSCCLILLNPHQHPSKKRLLFSSSLLGGQETESLRSGDFAQVHRDPGSLDPNLGVFPIRPLLPPHLLRSNCTAQRIVLSTWRTHTCNNNSFHPFILATTAHRSQEMSPLSGTNENRSKHT